MDTDGCLFVSGFDVDPNQRVAFERWYDEVHIPDSLRLRGFRVARRYTRAPGVENTAGPELLNVFEISDEEAFRASWDTPERRAGSDDFNRWARALSNAHVGFYVPLGPAHSADTDAR
jgi:hypothetical protein